MFGRKGLEFALAPIAERILTKDRILEVYLNIAELGKGVYGVQAASTRFFHKPASRLTSSEAATLAAVLPNPVRMHAERPSPYVSERREQILAQMRALGGASYLQALESESRPSPVRKARTLN